jgi:hypothetical protein
MRRECSRRLRSLDEVLLMELHIIFRAVIAPNPVMGMSLCGVRERVKVKVKVKVKFDELIEFIDTQCRMWPLCSPQKSNYNYFFTPLQS